ncbi:MAG: hypothetical protein CML02_22845 [Pseudooceanicola sp.]|jgi:hypothetical protein|nr:hypothetical protein [Pseudooceanicola sp.]
MPIDGLTDAQSNFVETFILIPRGFGRKKAEKRRDKATVNFRRFNVQKDAVKTRIEALGDPVVQKLLKSQLARAEEAIGTDPKALDFDTATTMLIDVNKAVAAHARQLEVRGKHALMLARMDVVENSPPLDNIDDINRVWAFADTTFDSGARANDPTKLNEAERALDQLAALIDAGRPDVTGDGRESKRKLRDVGIALAELQKGADAAFTKAHVPPPLTALFKTVQDRLDDGEAADVAGLPAAATAAEQALAAADTGYNRLRAEVDAWQRAHTKFLPRYKVMIAHPSASEATYVAPRFLLVTNAYKAAADLSLAHDYAGAAAALIPVATDVEAAITFADSYEGFLDLLEKRRAMVDALPAANTRTFDQIKTAITDNTDLLTQATDARDAGNMVLALTRLNDIAREVPKVERLIYYEDVYVIGRKKLTKYLQKANALNADLKALIATDLVYYKKLLDDSKPLADGGRMEEAAGMIDGLGEFDLVLDEKIEQAEKYIVAKTEFDTHLAAANAITGPNGRVAIADYIAQLQANQIKIVRCAATGALREGRKLCEALSDKHNGQIAKAGYAKDYLAHKAALDNEIAALETGGAGQDQATQVLAMAKTLRDDALTFTQKDDWFQAVRLVIAGRRMAATAKTAADGAAGLDALVDTTKLDAIAADFAGAKGEFDRVHNQVGTQDADGIFSDELTAADTKANRANGLLPADAAGARAQLDEAISDCRDILTKLTQRTAYDAMREALKTSLEDIESRDKKKLLKPEMDAIKGHLRAAEQAADPGKDFASALDQMRAAQVEVRNAYGICNYIDFYLTATKRLDEIDTKLRKKDIAPGLTDEITRFEDGKRDTKTAWDDRKMAEMQAVANKTITLGFAFLKSGQNYKDAKSIYAKNVTKRLGDEMANPGATHLAGQIRAGIANYEQAMNDSLYDTAFFVARDVGWLITEAKTAAKTHDAWLPVKAKATAALTEIEDRDDPANGPAHARIIELRAIYDDAIQREGRHNYSGALGRLKGFDTLCKAVEPMLDAFDLMAGDRAVALQAVADLGAMGTDPIAPMFARIEGKRDNAQRLAGAFDFAQAHALFRELPGDCETAKATLQRQAEFGTIMDQINDVDDGDTDDLKAAIAAAKATHANLAARPAALFVKTRLDDLSDTIDRATGMADADFDGALALLTGAVTDCTELAGEMGRFDQFSDTVELARGLVADLRKHAQAGFVSDELTALLARVDGGMARVRADATQRRAVRDDVEAVIATCRDLREVLDDRQIWEDARAPVATDLAELEKHEDRHIATQDIAALRVTMDASEAKADTRDHAGAMADLVTARGLVAKARLRIKVTSNTAPNKKELQDLLAAPGGDAVLDDVVNKLDEDTRRKVMTVAFEARFGCKLELDKPKGRFAKIFGSKGGEKKAPNIQRFFEIMSALPPSTTLDNDSMLIFSNKTPEEGDTSYFDGTRKEVAMREGDAKGSAIYGIGLEHELGADPATLELQHGKPMDFFSWNTLHEVGHAVDDKLGFMDGPGAAMAGWETFGANVRPAAAAIAAEMDFDANYVAEYMSSGPGSAPPIPEPNGCSADEWEARRREACAWVDRVRTSENPWGSDSIAKQSTCANGKVYHESYDNDWSCYNYAARANGVSGYQFRAPGEWFSELFAAVHSGKIKNSHVHYNAINNAR